MELGEEKLLGLKCQCGFGSGTHGPLHRLRVPFVNILNVVTSLKIYYVDADFKSNFELTVLLIICELLIEAQIWLKRFIRQGP